MNRRVQKGGGSKRVWVTRSGRRITEVDAAKLAREFESSSTEVDARTTVFPRKVGRPSLEGKDGSSTQITFRLDTKSRKAAEKLAAREGVTVSALARKALLAKIARAK